MNLFRSEEHARRWDRFVESMSPTLLPLAAWADIFSNPFFRQRRRRDYVSWTRSEAGAAALSELRARLPQRSDS